MSHIITKINQLLTLKLKKMKDLETIMKCEQVYNPEDMASGVDSFSSNNAEIMKQIQELGHLQMQIKIPFQQFSAISISIQMVGY